MALIKCNECGNEVSDQAFTCPKCGAPLKVMSQKTIQNDLEKKVEGLTPEERTKVLNEWWMENHPSLYKTMKIIPVASILLIVLGFAVSGLFLIIAGIMYIIMAVKLKSLGFKKSGNVYMVLGIVMFGLSVVSAIVVSALM